MVSQPLTELSSLIKNALRPLNVKASGQKLYCVLCPFFCLPPSFYPSRAHSPGMAAPSFSGAARFNTSFHSPSPRGHHGMIHSPNSTVNETMLVPEMEPIIPDLCMEQLWSETVTAGCHR